MIYCPICKGSLDPVFEAEVLCRYKATFDYCHNCGFLRARNPVWLPEAYSSAIASMDTGIVMRNIHIANKLTKILVGVLGERGRRQYCDIAGGYGMLTRLMRDSGFDFYWLDKYCENFMARGFEYRSELGPCHGVTAIEVMEHLEDPLGFVRDALKRTMAQVFMFTTDLFDGPPPAPSEWWYYSFETGQHISFFQRRTLDLMAKQLGLFFVSHNGMHIFSRERIALWRLKLVLGRFGNVLMRTSRRHLASKVMLDHHLIKELLKKKNNNSTPTLEESPNRFNSPSDTLTS